MKYFLDTEFIEQGHGNPIQLVSIGVVAEDGREYYAINSGFDPDSANEWVRQNVLPSLGELPLRYADRVLALFPAAPASTREAALENYAKACEAIAALPGFEDGAAELIASASRIRALTAAPPAPTTGTTND